MIHDLLDEDGFFHLDERDILASRDVDRFTAEDLERAERLFAAWVTAVHCTVVYCVTAVGQDHATLGTAINAGIQLLGPPGAIWVYLQTLNFVRKAREDGGITPWW